MSRRPSALIAALYPRTWRRRYADELADLCDEYLIAGETTRVRLAMGIAGAALAQRLRSFASPRRRLLVATSGLALAVVAALGASSDGFGLLAGPTREHSAHVATATTATTGTTGTTRTTPTTAAATRATSATSPATVTARAIPKASARPVALLCDNKAVIHATIVTPAGFGLQAGARTRVVRLVLPHVHGSTGPSGLQATDQLPVVVCTLTPAGGIGGH